MTTYTDVSEEQFADFLKERGYQGTDESVLISLYEYGFVARRNVEDDGYVVLYRVEHGPAAGFHWGHIHDSFVENEDTHWVHMVREFIRENEWYIDNHYRGFSEAEIVNAWTDDK